MDSMSANAESVIGRGIPPLCHLKNGKWDGLSSFSAVYALPQSQVVYQMLNIHDAASCTWETLALGTLGSSYTYGYVVSTS